MGKISKDKFTPSRALCAVAASDRLLGGREPVNPVPGYSDGIVADFHRSSLLSLHGTLTLESINPIPGPRSSKIFAEGDLELVELLSQPREKGQHY